MGNVLTQVNGQLAGYAFPAQSPPANSNQLRASLEQRVERHLQRVKLIMIASGPKKVFILQLLFTKFAYGSPKVPTLTLLAPFATELGTVGSFRAQNHRLMCWVVRSMTYL